MSDRDLRTQRREVSSVAEAVALAHALLRADGEAPVAYDLTHRYAGRTSCGLPSRPVWTVDCDGARWLAQPWRDAKDAARLCPACDWETPGKLGIPAPLAPGPLEAAGSVAAWLDATRQRRGLARPGGRRRAE